MLWRRDARAQDVRKCNKCGVEFRRLARSRVGECRACRKALQQRRLAYAQSRPPCPRCSHPLDLDEYGEPFCPCCGLRNI